VGLNQRPQFTQPDLPSTRGSWDDERVYRAFLGLLEDDTVRVDPSGRLSSLSARNLRLLKRFWAMIEDGFEDVTGVKKDVIFDGAC